MNLTLLKDKVTKNGITRFADKANHNIYLSPAEIQALDNPVAIKLTIEKVTMDQIITPETTTT